MGVVPKPVLARPVERLRGVLGAVVVEEERDGVVEVELKQSKRQGEGNQSGKKGRMGMKGIKKELTFERRGTPR